MPPQVRQKLSGVLCLYKKGNKNQCVSCRLIYTMSKDAENIMGGYIKHVS